MKKIQIIFTLCLIVGVGLVALSKSARHGWNELQTEQTAWQAQSQKLAAIQTETAGLTTQITERKQELQDNEMTPAIDLELADFLMTNDVNQMPAEWQNRMLASFGGDGISSDNYVLVSKAALSNAHIKPLKVFPHREKLTDNIRGVLAITPEEQQAVESAFTNAFDTMGEWARVNVRRDGPDSNCLVQFTIPEDQAFETATIGKLFSEINSAIGNERGEILHKSFEVYRLNEDGAVGDRTNILAIYRIATPPGYGYRDGWIWSNHSEAVNTYPEPIKPGTRFPAAFRFIFPGGWEELAEREGFELPDEFKKH